MIIRYTASEPFVGDLDIPHDDRYLVTWAETYKNGAIRRDLVDLTTGDSLTIDVNTKTRRLRAIADFRGTLEEFFKYLNFPYIPQVHCAKIGTTT